MKFVQENELLYIGESSALADINIKEVVETLMESKFPKILYVFICMQTYMRFSKKLKQRKFRIL